ncbi:Hsp20/alpha crystallin family protein [Draconibacterium sp. IB214405]|uniref:Hsp20/alpha crystallin family protein n=1 Tax=Draconibacterium sp. IB214405 TaxID=3097352 RepID=UPI002A0AFAB0|nr:Hsp20/alpha crystallin family protein [Draconibacterium sp. IB214405]MDX8339555.1 Hsp20/alpha crystallin family protein [Draconibacterium sp. IB214405]
MNLVRFENPRYNVNRTLVDELFNNFLKSDYHENYVNNSGVSPATNVFETEKEFKIEVLLPGFVKEDLQLNVHKNVLTVKVEKEEKENNEVYKYAHREFGAKNFEKKYRLPKSVDAEKISAKFENGILNIELPKKEEALEKEPLEIKVS